MISESDATELEHHFDLPPGFLVERLLTLNGHGVSTAELIRRLATPQAGP